MLELTGPSRRFPCQRMESPPPEYVNCVTALAAARRSKSQQRPRDARHARREALGEFDGGGGCGVREGWMRDVVEHW